MSTAAVIAKTYGMSMEDVVESLESNLFSYVNEPKNIKEAFLFASESDYKNAQNRYTAKWNDKNSSSWSRS